ncbi:hypothetical protein EV191_105317 [Tamaricihabitans halophyticus]|uniref:Excreted virulence factor EspC (Type VII ESX diderm) n=1 Tax=Tamaricihabitans halophyticus TaxID=1262583 RepID=A0A4R2QTI2_9PSEU|nr:hypothetical protein [Tamaricihabitans halophyticus]TCP53250.1 hypothetical protein EV191_105317 [Tamaricihabitans halophyticus]
MAGYGVDAGQVQQAAGQFEKEAGTIGDHAGKVQSPGVGAGQVGRAFQEFAGQYEEIFNTMNASIKSFGQATTQVATQLSDVSSNYSESETTNTQTMKAQGGA